MNDVKITGEVVFVDEVKEYGANAFRKHVVVVKTGDDKWANPIPVEFTKEAIEKSTQLKTGQRVVIEARLNGREWKGQDGITKWFVSVNGYEIASSEAAAASEPNSTPIDELNEEVPFWVLKFRQLGYFFKSWEDHMAFLFASDFLEYIAFLNSVFNRYLGFLYIFDYNIHSAFKILAFK